MKKSVIKVAVCMTLCVVLVMSSLSSVFAQVDLSLLSGDTGSTGTTQKRLVVKKYDGMGRVLSGIEVGSTVAELNSNFSGYSLSVTDKSGNPVADTAAVGTGYTVTSKIGETVVNTYTSLIYGDINGDTNVSSVDQLLLRQHLLGSGSITGTEALSADVDKNDSISSTDGLALSLNMLGAGSIDQGAVEVPVEENGPIKVLTIGDSLTDADTWRYNFVKSMLGAGADFEMVGTEGSDSRFDEFPNGDKYKGNCARGGYSIGPDTNRIGNVARELNSYLSVDYDMVLIMVGHNSFVPALGLGVIQDKVADNYLNLVDKIYQDNPNAVVVCATVAPMQPRTPGGMDYEISDGSITGLNPYIPKIVNRYREMGKHITYVDLLKAGLVYEDWNGHQVTDGDMTHPLESGYIKIAAKWFDGAKDYILGANGKGPVEELPELASDAPVYDDVSATKSFDFESLKRFKSIALTDTGTQALLTMNGEWANGEWGSFSLGNNGSVIYNSAGADMAQIAGDKNFYAFETHVYCSSSDNGSVLAYVSYTDANNYVAAKFSPRSDQSLVQVVKVADGIESVLGSAPYRPGGMTRLGVIVKGTKVSVGINLREVLTDVEVGVLPNGFVGLGCVNQKITINMWNLYVPYDDYVPLAVTPYNFTITKGADMSAWTLDNVSFTAWSNDIQMAAYGGGNLMLNNPLYTGDFYAKFKLSNFVNDNRGSATIYLSKDSSFYAPSPFQDACSTAIIITPRGSAPYDGYTVTFEQRFDSAVTIRKTTTRSSQFIGDNFNVQVYDENGMLDVYCTDSAGNTTQWFNDIPVEIPKGKIGFSDWQDDFKPKTVQILPVNDPAVPVRPVMAAAGGMSIDKTTLALEVSDSAQITATVTPAEASNKRVMWQSSNTAIATVSGGKVTAKAPGAATITAITEDGNFQSTCEVTVSPMSVGDDIAVLPPLGAVLYQNDFSTQHDGWSEGNINYSGAIQIADRDGSCRAMYGNAFSGSYQIKADINVSADWHTVNLIFNYKDDSNYYYINITGTGSTVETGKYVNGQKTVFKRSTLYRKNAVFTYTINQFGNTLEIYRSYTNGLRRERLCYIENNTDTSGNIAFSGGRWNWNTMDNVIVTAIG